MKKPAPQLDLAAPTSHIARQAIKFAAAGFSLITLNGKVPTQPGWQKTPHRPSDEVPEWLTKHGDNYGVCLSPEHLVIDVDPRRFQNSEKPLLRLLTEAGISPEKLSEMAAIVVTGSGGHHIYLRLPKGIRVRNEVKGYDGLEFKSQGRQVVGPGSIHPDTGKKYKWHTKGCPIAKIQMAPPALLAIISKRPQDDPQEPYDGFKDDDKHTILRYIETLKEAPGTAGEHRGDNATFQMAAAGYSFGLSSSKVHQLLMEHYNHKCGPGWSSADMMTKVRNAFEYATGPKGSELPDLHYDILDETSTVVYTPASRTGSLKWHSNSNGIKKLNLHNTVNFFLEPTGKLLNTLGHNAFEGSDTVLKTLPWDTKNDSVPRQWTDTDTVRLMCYLSSRHKFDIGRASTEAAIVACAKMNEFHPLRDYLRALTWDKKPRINRFLIDHGGAEDNLYVEACCKLLILQAVERGLHPGAKADYVVVMESGQGKGKTRLLETLGGDWYASIHLDTKNKDTVDGLRGKWWIEMEEMEVTRRAEADALKAFISRRVDRVRPAYGKKTVDFYRSCVFSGSVNPNALGEYLIDPTGNRRFLPIRVGTIDVDAVAKIRDQLFAEAIIRLESGEKTWIDDPKLEKRILEEQALRQSTDPWHDWVDSYIKANKPEKIKIDHMWFGISGQGAMGNLSGLSKVYRNRIANILRHCGYEAKNRRVDGIQTKAYFWPIEKKTRKRKDPNSIEDLLS